METLKFGKKPAVYDSRTLKMAKYVKELAPPPKSYNIFELICRKLNIYDPSVLYPMDGNDQYGDCVCAAIAHAITTYGGLIGNENIPESRDVVRLYKKLTRCRGDVGLNELQTLKKWRKRPLLKEQILAFTEMSPRDHLSIMHSIHLFGGCFVGMVVQENAIADFQAKRIWTPGSLTGDGHCVYFVAYNENGVMLLTWGGTQLASWEWVDECLDEAYAIIPPEAKNPSFAPGFAFEELMEDLTAVQKINNSLKN